MTKFSSIVESKLNDLTSLSKRDEEVKSLLSEAGPAPAPAPAPATAPAPGGIRGGGRGGRNRNISQALNDMEVRGEQKRTPFVSIREGTYSNTYNKGDPIVMWFLQGMKGATSGIQGKLTKDISCVNGLHPQNIMHLYDILCGKTHLNPTRMVTDNKGHVSSPVAAMSKDMKGKIVFNNTKNDSSWSIDYGTAPVVVLDPDTTYDECCTQRGGASEKYGQRQYYQSMYWVFLTAMQPEGQGIFNSDAVISKFYKSDMEGFKNYWHRLAENDDIVEALYDIDDQNDAGGHPLLGGKVKANKLSGGQMGNTVDMMTGVASSKLAAKPQQGMGGIGSVAAPMRGVATPTSPGQLQDSALYDETEEHALNAEMDEEEEQERRQDEAEDEADKVADMDIIAQRIYKIGDMYEQIVPMNWFKDYAYTFVTEDMKNHFVDGIPQLISAKGLSYTTFFVTTPDRNLWYGINHYPPQATQWKTRAPFLANVLLMSDKERPKLARIKSFIDANKVNWKESKHGGMTVKTL